jgi:hypothetical protein
MADVLSQKNREIARLQFTTKTLTVIPAKAGIHASCWRWIPRSSKPSTSMCSPRVPAFAGMTVRSSSSLRALEEADLA